MFEWMINVIMWFKKFWDELPQSVKDEIIESIVNIFKTAFEAYYDTEQQETNQEN